MVAAFSFGPLGAMTDLVVAPGAGVESGRGRSEFVSGGGVRWARQGASSPRTWRVARSWQEKDFTRLLDLAAHSPASPFYLYDRACAARNLLPAKDSFGIPATRTNLCVNPGWESGFTQFGVAPAYAGAGVSGALATNWFDAGTRSAKFTFTNYGSALPFGAYAGTMARAGLLPGRTYTVSATMRYEPTAALTAGQVPEQANIAWALQATTPTASNVIISAGAAIPMRAWVGRRSFQFTIPEDATEAAIVLSTNLFSSMRPGTLWVDSITLEEGVSEGSYFDGGSSGYAWSGTANASSTVPSMVPVAGIPMPPVRWTKARAFVLAGRTYTLSAWTTGAAYPLTYQETGNPAYSMPAPVGGLSQTTFTPTVSRVMTLTRPAGRVVSGVRIHEGVADGTFYPSEGTPTRVAVTDPGRTYQLVTGTQTLTDYDVELKEIGVQGNF